MSGPWDDPGVRALVDLALAEDEVHADVTSAALVPPDALARARLLAREPGRIAGLPLLTPGGPLLRAFPDVEALPLVAEGADVGAGEVLARLAGPARQLLAVERVLLNFLQRLSGIATATATFVAAVAGTGTRIMETRKTCPGWRLLDKYAVAVGGGLNHRTGLGDQVLVKENHLVFLERRRRDPAAVAEAVRRARAAAPPGTVVEVEVETLEQLEAALAAGPDAVMLDDFSEPDLGAAVAARGRRGGRIPIEVSGGVRLEDVRRLAELGVDRVSVGALTHSVRALDLALETERGDDAEPAS